MQKKIVLEGKRTLNLEFQQRQIKKLRPLTQITFSTLEEYQLLELFEFINIDEFVNFNIVICSKSIVNVKSIIFICCFADGLQFNSKD